MNSLLLRLKSVPLSACVAAASEFRVGVLRGVGRFSTQTSVPSNRASADVSDAAVASSDAEQEVNLGHDFEVQLDLVAKYLSQDNMSRSELVKQELQRVREQFKVHDVDTGSSSVQIALLTTKIKSLHEHLGKNKKDKSSRRGLQGMYSQRYRLLKYLRRTKPAEYQKVIVALGLKDRSYKGNNYELFDKYK